MNVQSFYKTIVIPLIGTTLIVILIFFWGSRQGSFSQKNQLEPLINECISENRILRDSVNSQAAAGSSLKYEMTCGKICSAISEATGGSLSSDGGYTTGDAHTCVCFFMVGI
jgi:hypothetical protein